MSYEERRLKINELLEINEDITILGRERNNKKYMRKDRFVKNVINIYKWIKKVIIEICSNIEKYNYYI